jgi:hypothetical protein
MDFITANLRPSIFEDPKNEKELQNIVEVMLRAREYEYRRELIRIPYSSKVYIPDFTFEVLHLALEMKLCSSRDRVREMIDEINSDIPAYQTRYENVIFAIYDLGQIRDEAEFKGSIERNLNVYVVIVKKYLTFFLNKMGKLITSPSSVSRVISTPLSCLSSSSAISPQLHRSQSHFLR